MVVYLYTLNNRLGPYSTQLPMEKKKNNQAKQHLDTTPDKTALP